MWEVVPVAILLGVPLALWKNYWYDRTPFQKRHLLALIPFLFPILILIWGNLFAYYPSEGKSDYTILPMIFIQAFLLIQLLIHVGCFIAFKGVRLSVFSLALFQAGLSLIAWFIAGMQITGTYL